MSDWDAFNSVDRLRPSWFGLGPSRSRSFHWDGLVSEGYSKSEAIADYCEISTAFNPFTDLRMRDLTETV